MPGWHEKTAPLQESGALQVVGLVQEQHADRTRLFLQWQQMKWPVLVDSLNLLGVGGVPITFLIDEAGVIRYRQPDEEELQAFLERARVGVEKGQPSEPPSLERLRSQVDPKRPSSLLPLANALFLWGESASDLDESIRLYEEFLEERPDEAAAHFRLGVAYRKRYESQNSRVSDFQSAISQWQAALQINPNQYIWRRRIQQYGPRLDKPYSFYDWVHRAREEIRARGEEPVELRVEPGGAEFAYPADEMLTGRTRGENPDPESRIFLDRQGLIDVETVAVPHTSNEGSYRVHLVFRPDLSQKAHWNNEVEDMLVWVEPPQGWQVDPQLLTYEIPAAPTSQEVRRLEVELQAQEEEAPAGSLQGYALYYVCEDVNGTCLYRRQNFSVPLAP